MVATAPPPAPPGFSLAPGGPNGGRYQILAELDRGGMGIVYLAALRGPVGFSKIVVIKRLKPALAEDAACRDMFQTEARVGAKLTHPNIVQTFEIVSEGDSFFTVMEFLDGPSLRQILRALKLRGAPTRGLYLRAILEVLKALDYAHTVTDHDGSALHLVHRDVSPHNVIITYDGQVKLFDFGIVKTGGGKGLQEPQEPTLAGVIKGKPHYMSPEQAAGEAVDHRSDLFAVGIMMWEALTGARFWAGKKDSDVLRGLFGASRLPFPREVLPDVDRGLEVICMRALARSPDERFPSARAFHDALEARIAEVAGCPSLRDLSELVSTEFADARRDRRANMEARLALATTATEGTLSSITAIGPYPSFGVDQTASVPSVAATIPGAFVPLRAPVVTAPPPPLPDPFPVHHMEPKRRSRGGAVVVVMSCVLALAALGVGGKVAWTKYAYRRAVAAQTTSAPASKPVVTADVVGDGPVVALAPPPVADTAVPVSRNASAPAPAPVADASARAGTVAPTVRGPRQAPPPRTLTPPKPDPSPPPVAVAPALAPPEPVPAAAVPAAAPATPAPPPATPATPVPDVKPGTVSRADVNATVRSHRADVETCFERARMETPDLSTRMSVKIALDGDGRVTGVSTSSTRSGTARLEACMSSAIRAWRFPAPTGNVAASVPYTFVFE